MDPAVDPVTEFLAALRDADSALASARAGLTGAGVPDGAFGRLFEAHEVRDAYHERLPGAQRDIDEARAVLGHFVAGLGGGHRIVDAVPAPPRPRPGQT
jgi:hypothetical protein